MDDFNAGAGLPVVTYPDGLKFIDLKVGTKAVAQSGESLTVQYTGWTTDGKMFDSSVTRGQPATFPLDQVRAAYAELEKRHTRGKIVLIP